MIDSMAVVPACARAVDAGRRGPKGNSAGCPGPFGPWRSGAAERVQAGAGVAESAIWRAHGGRRARRAREPALEAGWEVDARLAVAWQQRALGLHVAGQSGDAALGVGVGQR